MQTLESASRTLRFSVFEVDLRAAELRKHGVRIKLQDQPFRILSRLLDHPGDIVTREELRRELWHDHTFVDFDRSLNKAMAKLRSALGDSAETPRYIETIPRHGYRLLVPVAQSHLQDSTAPVHAQQDYATEEFRTEFPVSTPTHDFSAVEKPARLFYSFTEGWSFSFLMAVIVTLVVLAGVMSFRLKQSEILYSQPASVNPRKSVAVLGFHNLSGDTQDAWLSTAFSDWLATELSAGDQLRTVSAENIARMKLELQLPELDSLGRDSLARIQKDLGSDLVVAGSYAMLGKEAAGQIRLDVRLLDARTGETLFATSETGTEANLFGLVSRAGENLRRRLGVRSVTQAEAVEVALALPSNAAAARLYSEGLQKLRIFDALAARDLLQQAVAKEPDYSLAHAALATAWSQLGYDENAKTEAKKAFDLSSNLSRADRLQVEGRYRETSHEWEKAIEIYNALFEFFPDNLEYGLALCNAQVSEGRGKDALATLAQLQKLPLPLRDDPRIDLEEDHAVESLGDFKNLLSSSMRAAEKAKAMGTSLLQARALTDQSWALENLGAPDKVEPMMRDAEQLYIAAHDQRGVAIAATIGGIALQMQGDYQGAKKKYEESLAIYQRIGYRFGVANEYDNFGDVYLALGDLPNARKSYEESLKTYLEIGHIDGEALAKAGLGEVFLRQGNIAESKKMLEESLAICRQIGDRSKEGVALSGLGRLLRMEGDSEAAWNDETEAKAIFDKIGDKSQSAEMQIYLGELLIDQAKSDKATVLAREAAEFFEKSKASKNEAAADLVLSRAALAEGRITEATGYLEKTMATAKKSRNRELELCARILAARLGAASGNGGALAEAERRLSQLSSEAKNVGLTNVMLDARLVQGEVEMLSSDQNLGRNHLEALKKEAIDRGFGGIARKADAALHTGRKQTLVSLAN